MTKIKASTKLTKHIGLRSQRKLSVSFRQETSHEWGFVIKARDVSGARGGVSVRRGDVSVCGPGGGRGARALRAGGGGGRGRAGTASRRRHHLRCRARTAEALR